MTDAPRISAEEVTRAMRFVIMQTTHPGQRECMKAALAAFLAARVPGANPMYYGKEYHKGFNACRDQVLKGRE